MEFNRICLHPKGAFHFGIHGIDMESVIETCPSDTLYAALFWQALQQGQAWVGDDTPTPPFTISSCFPFVGNVQLLPIPMLPPGKSDQQQAGERKRYKKIRFVSSTIFNELLNGASLRDYFDPKKGIALQQGKVLITTAEYEQLKLDFQWDLDKPIWKLESVPHVTADRVTNASAYYETGQVHFNQDCGLAILALGDMAQLMPLLQEIGIDGLGGRRSKGLGQFEPEHMPERLELPAATSKSVIVLSRYLPSQAELAAGVLNDPAAYSLEDVTGWMYSPSNKAQRRNAIWMLGVGSQVYRGTRLDRIRGSIVDVRPIYDSDKATQVSHPVWRHGLALAVGYPAGDK